MPSHQHRHSIFCILPPHILEAIAKQGDKKDREWALQTLAADTSARSERITQQMLRVAAGPPAPSLLPHKQRQIFTANNGGTLPGTAVRSEGQGATGDAAS